MKGNDSMKKEELIEKGLSDEHAQAVIDIYTEEMKGYIPKTRFDEVNNTKKELESQITDRDKQLKDLKGKVGDNEQLKTEIEKLQNENKQTKADYESKMLQLEKTSAVKEMLKDAKYPDLLLKEFDLEKIQKNSDGTFTGITEQLEAKKQAFPDMFIAKVTGTTPKNNGGTPTANNRLEQLQVIINDPKTKFVDRIAARNELAKLQAESEV